MPVCQMPQLHVSSLYLRFDKLRGTGILLNLIYGINVTGCRHFFNYSYTGSAFIWSLGVSKNFCLLKNVLTVQC